MDKWRTKESALAARIRKARREIGWTQTQLGEAIGVSQQEIAKYEAGLRDPTAHMRAIAAALRRPLDHFYKATPVRKAIGPARTHSGRGRSVMLDNNVILDVSGTSFAAPKPPDLDRLYRSLFLVKNWRRTPHV